MSNFFTRLFGKKGSDVPMRDVSALVTPFATPAIQLVSNSATSFSHFGGSPKLPPDIVWPEKGGMKLAFLARLSLAEIQSTLPIDWLPQSGALLFFYDMEKRPWGYDPNDRGSSAVLLVPDLAVPAEQLDDRPNGNESPLPHRNVSFRRIDVLRSLDLGTIDALNLTEEEIDEYCRISDIPFHDIPKHQIAGFPAPVQEDNMELECQLVSNGLFCGDANGYKDPRVPSLTPGAANWRLLLQIDSDDDLGVMWGDCGTIYYWVEAHKAKVGNFANTWLVLQCT